ncbi:MAG: hypothetical protein A3I68_05175 [Candidatus Melainabacteria bacterium RIFCSPLOWO2_02_FULL_35_15]|nr:MAG: hypothetical protein A3F80_07485 [Candidatus Melainabacteria bacterium RIFCSPLOWO2_12_FULL_35_11]OGI12843.1 MAG: hypothetical protein A3I68_05175 [Candidatus Melainabacteria bacterium RIFCSPLOWO2_02_FULL_35_15]
MKYKSNLVQLIKFDNYINSAYKNRVLIGIDEVGRGALAGPVIACAFFWKVNPEKINKSNYKKLYKLNDSKQLNSKERNELCKYLKKYGNYSLGYASVQEIEKLNILNATFLAMKRAYEQLIPLIEEISGFSPYILIDGNKFNPYINCPQLPIVDGDAKSSVIASASIIAKVYRDKLMEKISKSKKYKHFGWNKNVGYGTAFHRNAIKKNGLTPLHRKLFVRKVFA